MENADIKTAEEIKKVLTEKIDNNKRTLNDLMFESIKLLPYINSHRTLHRRYRVPMLQVIGAALMAANNKFIELKVYDELNSKNNVVLNEVSKEIPKEN
jgi:hypothetical protein